MVPEPDQRPDQSDETASGNRDFAKQIMRQPLAKPYFSSMLSRETNSVFLKRSCVIKDILETRSNQNLRRTAV